MSSLMKTLRRWNWTVRGARNSRVAISGLDRPSAASRAIRGARRLSLGQQRPALASRSPAPNRCRRPGPSPPADPGHHLPARHSRCGRRPRSVQAASDRPPGPPRLPDAAGPAHRQLTSSLGVNAMTVHASWREAAACWDADPELFSRSAPPDLPGISSVPGLGAGTRSRIRYMGRSYRRRARPRGTTRSKTNRGEAVTQDVSHEFQFPRQGTKVHRIAPIDGPNMSNLGHRSKKVYGPNQGTIESLHA
jgi:hypothetical protein